MTYLEQATKAGHAQLDDGVITYIAANKSRKLKDPEEQVRAEFWAELIHRYGYDPAAIGIEVVVPDRVPSDRADLVVFRDVERTRPYAVIECKRDGISDAEFEQAVEQAVGNGTWAKFRADYVMVVAGSTRRTLEFTSRYGILERQDNIVADLPKSYGKPEEFKYYRGGKQGSDLSVVEENELANIIRKCHQSLWGGGKLSPPAAFGELSKIIFVKVADEEATRDGEPYQFQIKTHEPPHRLATRIRDLYESHKKKDPDIFTDNIRIDDGTIQLIVAHFESINLGETHPDVKGYAFQQFMDGFFKGDFGQYFTPRPLIEFAVKMMNPQVSDKVLDPACGSGGFLLEALRGVKNEALSSFPSDPARQDRYWRDFARGNLFGIEINDEIARVAKMNMILHGDGHSNIAGSDALNRIERLREQNRGLARKSFDLVLTNPPFGAQVTLVERPYLADYELGKQTDPTGKEKQRRAQKTEILFIERIWEFLRPRTGRAAVVLPDGVLANASLQYVRDYMIERFAILAVVSLPKHAFAHFGTAVKASLVFLRKRSTSEAPSDDEEVFMAAPQFVGYDATGRPDQSDLDEVVVAYELFRQQHSDPQTT